jgi:hypothetical protein
MGKMSKGRYPTIREDKRAALERRVVRPEDLEPCVGPASKILCAYGDNLVRIKGYDDKWRCVPCNQLHGEMVFRESGNSAPTPSDETKMKDAKAKLFDQNGRPIDAEIAKQARKAARREAIARKYQAQVKS